MSATPTPTPLRADPPRRPRSDADALAQLDDARLLIWAIHQGAKLAWSLICKRFPDVKGW